MNPYEVSQASSDSIQALLDSAQKLLEGSAEEGSYLLLLPAVVERLKIRLLQLQQVHSRSWHLLRHNNEHAEFIMARLESMDVLCGRLIPVMNAARTISDRGKKKVSKSVSSARYGYELLRLSSSARIKAGGGCCYSLSRDDQLVDVLEAIAEELGTWLDYQEGTVERLSCQAFGVLARLQSHSLECYQPIPKLMRKIGEALIYGNHRCVIVHGPSGVGKSSLAAYVAANPPECFSDGAVDIHLGNVVDESHQLVSKLKHLLHDLNAHRESMQKIASLKDCWCLLEEVLQDSCHLIVLDDVCDKEIVRRLMQLDNHSCKFLITCQEDHPIYQSDLVCSIKIGFKETDSVSKDILKFHSGILDTNMLPAAAGKLLKYCSHHPLSVAILGEALRGSSRKEEWNAVVNHFEVCSSGSSKKNKKKLKRKSVKTLNWLAGFVASIELGTVGLPQETQLLFETLAALSWKQAIPVECLRAIWSAVGGDSPSPFLVHARELIRRCLLNRHPDFIFYEVHELVETYFLERRVSAAVDRLLNLSQPGIRAVVAPWLLQFGNARAKEAAAGALRGIFILDNEELHAKSLASIVEVVKACSSRRSDCSSSKEEICKELNGIVGAEIVNLLFRASSAWVYSAITKYVAACFTDVDYEEYGKSLVASGLVEKLRTLLTSQEGVNALVKKDVADVLARLASTASRDKYVAESLVRANVMSDLVALMDARSGWIHEGVIHAVVKLTGIGDGAVRQMLETDLLEILLLRLRNRKHLVKCKSLETLGLLIRRGGKLVVERMLALGFVEEAEALLGSGSEDVQVDACVICKEVFLQASEEGLERILKSRIVEALSGLIGDGEMEVLRCRSVAALQVLVKLQGKGVADRIVRAAGVDSILKGLETPPNEATFTGAYRRLLKSVVD